MMCPPPRCVMLRAHSRASKKLPRAFVFICASHSAALVESTGAKVPTPALHMQASSEPSAESNADVDEVSAGSSEMSQAEMWMVPLAVPRKRAARALSSDSFRASRPNLSPLAASFSAIAAPMPRDAPEMMIERAMEHILGKGEVILAQRESENFFLLSSIIFNVTLLVSIENPYLATEFSRAATYR